MKSFNDSKVVCFFLKRLDCNDGVASHCITLINGLICSEWKVVLVTGPVTYDESCIDNFRLLKSMSEDWLRLDEFDPLRPRMKHIQLIHEFLSRNKVSLLHLHGYSTIPLAWVFKQWIGIKSVATYHPSAQGDTPASVSGSSSELSKISYRIILSMFSANAYIAYSSEIAEALQNEAKVPAGRISKILLGIDTKHFRLPSVQERISAKEKYDIGDQDFICALIGRLSWNKGHDVVIDAVRLLRSQTTRKVRCLFSGSGSNAESIKEYAFTSPEDYESFCFLDFVDDVREIYWASDVFVLPSRVEGFALVVSEAMACGSFAIRTPSGGAQDQIQENVTGSIVPFNDAKALSDKLISLMNSENSDSDEKALKISEFARLNFDAIRMIQNTVNLYNSLV
jgi:glycosyltransferase involved in cell wall biosynthesis